MTVLEMVEGVDLDATWPRVSKRQLEVIKHELRGYIQQLWKIPNLNDFVVGTLYDTHEMLFSGN
jgi:hypothetical protein